MAPQTATKLTYEDYLEIPNDGRRHEIIDGEHYVSPSPNTRHQRICKRIFKALLAVESPDVGEAFNAPYDVVLSIFDVVQPDVLFVTARQAHIINDKNVRGCPELVVEVLSESNRNYDERVKYQTYERLGGNEYWIVDPDRNVFKVFRRENDHFVAVPAADPLTTPLLPGFALPLSDVFA